MSPARPALIRLVSSRYRELQGLVTMMDAVWPLYMGALMVAATRLDGPYITPFVFALSAVPLVVVPIVHVCWLRPRILAYYRSRFGRVEGPSPFRGPTTMVQGVLVAAILAEAHNVAWLSVTVVLAAVGAWPAWIVWRDWPYRWHWLPAVVAATWTAAGMSRMPSYHA